jgi:hemerythrin
MVMAFLDWTDEYSVHVKSMDDQHRRLVELINQLHDAMRVGKGREVIGQVLDSVIRYTQTHFAAEERLMSANGYPALGQHKLEHESLVRQVAEIQKQVQAGKLTVSLSVLDFLKKWLVEHIGGCDQGYGKFLSAKSVSCV